MTNMLLMATVMLLGAPPELQRCQNSATVALAKHPRLEKVRLLDSAIGFCKKAGPAGKKKLAELKAKRAAAYTNRCALEAAPKGLQFTVHDGWVAAWKAWRGPSLEGPAPKTDRQAREMICGAAACADAKPSAARAPSRSAAGSGGA